MNPSISDYTITRLLGQGGMAEVYEGLDPQLDRPVAIKIIHPRLAVDAQFEERFRREARLVAALRHPHIVQVYDYQVAEDGPVMVMEFLPGGSLKDRMDDLRGRGERMALADAAAITDALASALDYAHRQGAVHRDVKPANVLFDREGAPVLADFGIARILDDESGLTQPGTIIGTPAYLSPEQAAGESAGPASDLYSLGIVLYEMVTGAPPFQGNTTAILTSHASAPPPLASSRVTALPPAVDRMLQRALAKSPAERFPSGAALAQAFRAATGAEAAAPPPLTEQPTLVEGGPSPGAGTTPQPAVKAQPQAASSTQSGERMARLAEQLEVLSPLVGHSIPEAYRDRRSRLASTLGLVGLLFAILKFATDFLDLAEKAWRPIGLALQALPALVGLLLLAGAGMALVALRRPNRLLNRRHALTLFVGLTLAGLLWSGWIVAQQLRPPDKLIVAIGEFERFSSRVGNPAGDLFVAMERAFAPLQERVSVQRTYRTYASAAEAKADGIARGAVALLWGSYSDDGVTVYLEAMEPPAQAKIGGVTLSLRQFAGLAQGLGLAQSAAPGQVGRFTRQPLYIPERVSFAAAETAQMTAAAAAVLGLSFQLADDHQTALQLYDQAITGLGDGRNLVGAETVYFQRGVLHWQTGEPEEAVADMERAVALAPDYYPAHFNLAVFYASGCATPERLAQAIAEAERAVELQPADDTLGNLLASLYLQAGRPQEALDLLADRRAGGAQDAQGYLFLAQVYTGLGRESDANGAVKEALALLTAQPADDAATLLTLGNAYILAEDYSEAREVYSRVTASAPENPEGWQGLGNAHFWLGDLSAAANAYTKVAKLTPESADGYLLLGLTAAAAQDRAGTIAALSQAMERSACDPTPALLLGGEYILQEEYEKGIEALQTALTIDAENGDALYLLGSAYTIQGDWVGASDAYAKAADVQPDDPEILRSLAVALSAQGKAVEAEGPWQRYTVLVPDDSEAWENLALALLFQGRYDEAEHAARNGLAVTPEAGLFVVLGMALDSQGRDAEAGEAYNEALALVPEMAGAYRGLAGIAERSGEIPEAIAAYEKAAQLSGGTAVDYIALAALYQQMGEVEKGLAAIEAALAGQPENGDALVRAGLLQRDAGDLSGAERSFQQAAGLRPEDPLPLLGLVQVAYQQCRLSTASQRAKQMADLAPTPFFRSLLASIYLAQARADDAQLILDELQASLASNGDAHASAARLLLRLGRLEEALAEYQMATEAAAPGDTNAALLAYELGDLYLLLGQPLPAASEYTRALELRPALIPARAGLGDTALWQGQLEAAAGHYAASLEALPAYRSIIDQENYDVFRAGLLAKQALALRALGQTQEAAEALGGAYQAAGEVAARAPQSPLAHFTLGVVHLLAEETAQAEAAFAQAVQCDASLDQARSQSERIVARFLGGE